MQGYFDNVRALSIAHIDLLRIQPPQSLQHIKYIHSLRLNIAQELLWQGRSLVVLVHWNRIPSWLNR